MSKWRDTHGIDCNSHEPGACSCGAVEIDEPAIGKFVRARVDHRGSTGWISGKVTAIKRDGASLQVENGWHINLDLGDELLWCADAPCPDAVR